MATVMVDVPDQIRAGFSGQLLFPGDDGYDQARRVHNGMIDKRPALIARCHTSADVVDAVNLARDRGLEISVRGGGHNVAGRAVTDGGVMIDLEPMRGVRVDPSALTIWAQGGTKWADLNRAAHVHGLATTGGVVSSTGVGGLTLGGGEGWLMGRIGMVVDNLLSVELVTASGEVVRASADEHDDLFWALRGGGGNFGVATAFEYRAHAIPTVYGGLVAHPIDAAADVFGFYREFTADVPDELTVFFGLIHAPDGSGNKLAALVLCHSGDDHARAEAESAPVLAFGAPLVVQVQRMPYPVMNTLMDDGYPRGALNYWKSAFYTELSDGVIETLAPAFAACPSPMTAVPTVHYHGATSRVDPTATAFSHRSGYSPIIIAQWTDPAETEANIAWAKDTFEALKPYWAEAAYSNNLSADDTGQTRQAYGVNYDRLVEAKRRWDPDNVFRLNLNIDPAG